ncbi:ABC transporter ATP-binding protein [Paenibacillus paeoniae]|uniref:ABC transporter ATP-binding protein n=1 Tax=Paenibacillus paeoniae TaxID=2292705 RepID=A0A371PKJ0_9BACL|nr:ABC transporter ATP-binding protein [Paenibacillus paeoniae]REK76706.1 ABC transporter ATP-binding protein [Paenibacillus paeoniae]
MKPLLEVSHLSTDFHTSAGKVRVVENVSFTLAAGQTLGIVGESGSGKSVTSLSVMRLLPKKRAVVQGSIKLHGTELSTLKDKELRKVRGNKIAMIFQEPMTALNPVFKIGNQLQEAIIQHTGKRGKQARELAIQLLKDVGISAAQQMMLSYPHQLSGGMRQRVMIAMAMSCDPEVLIADEPTTALDVTIQAQILDLMKELQRKRGTAIVLITHDLGVVAEMCDKVAVMYAGQIVEEADVKTLFQSPKHPYTKGLLQSHPQLSDDQQRLFSIAGQVPTPAHYGDGCRFASRCSSRMDICDKIPPAVTSFGDSQHSRCHLYGGEAHVSAHTGS